MARTDDTENRIKEVVELGRRNKELLPAVQNWCTHLDIMDISAGVVAEIYNLPIRFRFSCKHASLSNEGMPIEYLAAAFILRECTNCNHHSPLKGPNFGEGIIKAREQERTAAQLRKKTEDDARAALKDEINKLIAKTRSTAPQPALSILRLIEELDGSEAAMRAEELFEASKMQPSFFIPEALDALALHFDHPDWGGKAISTASNVVRSGQKLTKLALERCTELLHAGRRHEELAELGIEIIDFNAGTTWEDWLTAILSALNYLHMFGYSDATPTEKREAFVVTCIGQKRDRTHEIIASYLHSENKIVRVNIAGLINVIGEKLPYFSVSLLPSLVQAFELSDSRELESADHALAQTIALIIDANGESTLEEFGELFGGLKTEGARLSAWEVYDLLLENEQFLEKHPSLAENLAEATPKLLIDRNLKSEWRDKAFETMNLVVESGKAPDKTISILIGCLSQINDERHAHRHYLEEIKAGKVSTFNPLAGMGYWDIDFLESNLNRYRSKLVDMAGTLLDRKPESTYPMFSEVLTKLAEPYVPQFKTDLLEIAMKGLNSPRYITQYLPLLYSHLFDKDVNNRVQGIHFLRNLIDDYPQLVTETLLNLVDVFAYDPEIAIRANNLLLVNSIAQSPKFELTDKHVGYVEKAFKQSYIYILDRAVTASRNVFPSMAADQVKVLSLELANLAVVEDPNNEELREHALSVLLDISMVNPQFLDAVVSQILSPRCKSDDPQKSRKYVEKLEEIKKQYPKYSIIWLKEALGYLTRSHPDRYNAHFDPRNGVYRSIFDSSYRLLTRCKADLAAAGKAIAAHNPIDALNFIYLFCHFQFYKEAIDLIDQIRKSVADTKANEVLLGVVGLINRMIDCYTESSSFATIKDRIKETKDELQILRPKLD
jgi:hypothetical protein